MKERNSRSLLRIFNIAEAFSPFWVQLAWNENDAEYKEDIDNWFNRDADFERK